MNNKAMIEFEAEQDMKNSADLEGCYPPRPSASVDNALLDLRNSSYPTQPHSTIAKYRVRPELVPRVALLRLPCLINHKESNPERAWERGWVGIWEESK